MLRSARLFLKENQYSLLISMVFAIVYGLIVFFNHHCFRTFALDLGVYTNALYDYSHLQWNDATVFKEDPRNLLSDHFDLSLMVFSPLSWLLGAYTLLLIQIVSILAGAAGVYRYILIRTASVPAARLAMLHMLLFFSVFSALSFDYHSNVPAAMLLPWFFVFLHQKRRLPALLVFFSILICKESSALLLISVCAGLLVEYRRDVFQRKTLALLMAFSALYFVLVVRILMPALSPEGVYAHFKYHVLGNDYADALVFVFSRPMDTLEILFSNHSGDVRFDWVKAEFYLFISLSGFLFVLFRPAFLLMLLVPLLSKMAYDDPSVWSIDAHYAIEFAPLIAMGSSLLIAEIRKPFIRKTALLLLLSGSFGATVRLMDHTVYLHDYNRLRIYQPGHYRRGHDVSAIHKAMRMIPDTAVVSAQSPILPHLAWRDHIYQLPIVKDAGWMIASPAEPVAYPLQTSELLKLIGDSAESGRWEYVIHSNDVVLLRRR